MSLIVGVAISLLAWVVFRLVTHRVLAKQSSKSSTRASLILGVLAVLSNAVFWLAIPPIFGVAAIALAADARDRRPFNRDWLTGVAGALGIFGTLAALVLSCVG